MKLTGIRFAQIEYPWWVTAIIERLTVEQKLWSIPMSAPQSESIERVIDSDDISELYYVYEQYVEHMKAQSKKR